MVRQLSATQRIKGSSPLGFARVAKEVIEKMKIVPRKGTKIFMVLDKDLIEQAKRNGDYYGRAIYGFSYESPQEALDETKRMIKQRIKDDCGTLEYYRNRYFILIAQMTDGESRIWDVSWVQPPVDFKLII